MSQTQQKKKKTYRKELKILELTPQEARIADLYHQGHTQKEIQTITGHSPSYVCLLLKSEKAQKYIKKKRDTWENQVKTIHMRLLRKVEEQIEKGKIEEKTYFNKKGKPTSKVITKTALTTKDAMDFARLAGVYNPILTVKKNVTTKDDDKGYDDVIEHLTTLKDKDKTNVSQNKEERENNKPGTQPTNQESPK